LVEDLLRPMLKDWLDQNLPASVERIVQREIERIRQRSGQ
jgi:cell pole-organizing protein PopZ